MKESSCSNQNSLFYGLKFFKKLQERNQNTPMLFFFNFNTHILFKNKIKQINSSLLMTPGGQCSQEVSFSLLKKELQELLNHLTCYLYSGQRA